MDALATAAGLGIGMVQSLILSYAVRPDTTWIPSWLPTTGIQEAVPVLLIVGVLVWRGDALPDRATIAGQRLPASPTPRHVGAWTAGLSVLAGVGLLTFGTSYRQALIVSLVYGLLTLSIVVVTGYSGQISLAQMAFAGVAGFTVIRLAEHSVPFPVDAVLASLVATALGLAVAYPATRVRGMSLAIATLAMAVAVEQLVLASPPLSHGAGGSSAPPPTLFGIDLRVTGTGDANFRPAFGFTVLVVLVLCGLGVANLRRNRTGLRWLAVRANERAAAAAGRFSRSAAAARLVAAMAAAGAVLRAAAPDLGGLALEALGPAPLRGLRLRPEESLGEPARRGLRRVAEERAGGGVVDERPALAAACSIDGDQPFGLAHLHRAVALAAQRAEDRAEPRPRHSRHLGAVGGALHAPRRAVVERLLGGLVRPVRHKIVARLGFVLGHGLTLFDGRTRIVRRNIVARQDSVIVTRKRFVFGHGFDGRLRGAGDHHVSRGEILDRRLDDILRRRLPGGERKRQRRQNPDMSHCIPRSQGAEPHGLPQGSPTAGSRTGKS